MKNVRKGILPVGIIGCFMMLGALAQVAAAGEMPPADAEALWKYVTEADPYTGWGFWPGRDGLYKGTQPHGAQLKLYANGPALEAAKTGQPMPYGAIVLKGNYGKEGKTLMAVTPMYKVKGFNPEGGDWFWAKYKAGGEVEKAGKVQGCINCHASRKDQNWIFNEVK